MGTWGAGNFENDGALDYLCDLVQRLEKEIKDCFTEENRADLDEDGEAVLIPSVAILSVLCEKFNVAPPKETVIKEWRETYLRIYDEQIDNLRPREDYKQERRQVIEETFAKLERIALSFYR